MKKFDSLTMYHHFTYDFEHKLQHLLSVLELPKESHLAERFKEIEKTLDWTFSLELLHHLSLEKLEKPDKKNPSGDHGSHPQLLLHLYSLLECTDSIEYIAHYLELTVEEVRELIRELHNEFSIESLVSRLRYYYEANKHIEKAPELRKERELLGIETTFEPKEMTEDRKNRLRRKYGRLVNVFERI